MNRDKRIIKFRAWDVHRDMMLVFENDTMFDTNWLNTSYAMQFTGRVINDTEIYEHDILRTPHYVDLKGKENYLYHEVQWDNEHTCWKCISLNNADTGSILANGNLQLWVYLKSEGAAIVFGNKFQNPELINQTT